MSNENVTPPVAAPHPHMAHAQRLMAKLSLGGDIALDSIIESFDTLPASASAPSPLANTNPEQAKATGWIVDKGDPGDWECISKAHNDATGEMKSTKRMRVASGYIYQMTTKTPASVAECAVFVPCAPMTNDAPVTPPTGYGISSRGTKPATGKPKAKKTKFGKKH